MYDLDLAKKHNIVISNVPSYSPETIAEYSVSYRPTISASLPRY